MTHYKGNKPQAVTQQMQQGAPIVDHGITQERGGAREGGERAFAEQAEKRAEEKHAKPE